VGSEAEVMCHSAIDLFSFLGVADFITKLRTGRFWATRTFDSFFVSRAFGFFRISFTTQRGLELFHLHQIRLKIKRSVELHVIPARYGRFVTYLGMHLNVYSLHGNTNDTFLGIVVPNQTLG